MPKDAPNYSRSRETYFRQTHRPLNSLAFLLPLLLVFHVGTLFFGKLDPNLKVPQDLKHLGQILGIMGPAANYLPPLLVVSVLLLMQFSRHEKWTVQKKAVLGMAAESLLWMAPLVAMVMLTGRLLLAATPGRPLLQGVILAIGAGIYEEFLFRLLLIGGAILLLTKVLGIRRSTVAVWSAILAGIAFSLYHFGPNQFVFSAFIIRALAGIYLGGLYLYRGFGIAVGAHVAYDIYAALAPNSSWAS
jgi:membrane protease YdiL (CAAX protease family)